MRLQFLSLLAVFCVLFGGSVSSVFTQEPTLEGAFSFNSRNITCATANTPGTNYTLVHHSANSCPAHDALAYDGGRGWGYEVTFPGAPNRNCAAQFGPMDDSPNNRGQFPDGCPNDLYDSFIGAKDFTTPCSEPLLDPLDPNSANACEDLLLPVEPEGIVFRVDVPNGMYRFVAVVGSPDNAHTSRILAENGGSGPPTFSDQLNDHVVLVHNYDQGADGGGAPFPLARVGFGCFGSPDGNGPQFVNMDEEGFQTDDPPNSPTLTVTEGYIRIHQLQGNNASGTDANGANMVLLELWRVDGAGDLGNGVRAQVSRSFDADPRMPGQSVTVTLSATDVPSATTIVETVPAGWAIDTVNNGGTQNGQDITFNVAAAGDVSYTVTAPSDCLPGNFSASVTPSGGCETFVESTLNCRPLDCELDPTTGALTAMLQLGPISLGQGASDNGGQCNDTDLDGNDFSVKDYLSGDSGNETNILVAVDDLVTPDFDIADPTTGGVGVAPAINPDLNPGFGFDLTVWRANAGDPEGLIDYNLAENIGDIDDYIIFSIVYLENTTAACLPVILEVGSDDAVKMRVNGALVHANSVCRGTNAYGAGDMVPVTLSPGPNIVLIGVVERAGGTGVRLVVRDTEGNPLTDGSVDATCEPPASYPSFATISRSITNDGEPGGGATVSLTASGVTGTVTVVETIPDGATIDDAGGGTVNGQDLTLSITADSVTSYAIGYPDDECPFQQATITGTVSFSTGCGALGGDTALSCVQPPCPFDNSIDANLEAAFYFSSRDLSALNPDALVNEITDAEYQGVIQTGDPFSVMYDFEAGTGFGYVPFYLDVAGDFGILDGLEQRGYDTGELLPPIHTGRGGWEIYGPLDESPNGRNEFPDDGPEEIYDSFIGAKNWAAGQGSCSQAINDPPDPNVPCTDGNLAPIAADGIVFRVDVPNGEYRFVAAVGDADNTHAHRLIAEDGGEGPPQDFDPATASHVVLVDNYDQSQQGIGEIAGDEAGDGVYGRVGFGGRIPPLGDGIAPSPQFVDMGVDGKITAGCAESPTLTVTQGYIRFHQLQANSNDGAGGVRDPNGGDLVVLEIWRVGDAEPGGFRRGDTDGVGGINLTDGVFLLNFLFLGGPTPPCADAADANDDGVLNITTGVFVFNWLFLGGPLPPAPGPGACGPDPTPDDLGCDNYENCQ